MHKDLRGFSASIVIQGSVEDYRQVVQKAHEAWKTWREVYYTCYYTVKWRSYTSLYFLHELTSGGVF